MLDCYGSDDKKLNDLRAIYETIHKITNHVSVKTIAPPVLVPYYYGRIKEDDGISAFVLLNGGHLTIHTFPERECYFVDILYDGFISEDRFVEVISSELPFDDKILNVVDRRFDIAEQCDVNSVDESMDFGPHYLMSAVSDKAISFERIYHFLDELPAQINMDAIMRPIVVTNKVKDFDIISGITVIAQSHIAVHYYTQTRQIYLDIFSCSFIDCDNIINIVEEKLGIKCKSILIGRGSKHIAKLAQRSEVIERYNDWQNNIR
jgi:S-adenosylmethionine/arginine decarboxylase-like enzyme